MVREPPDAGFGSFFRRYTKTWMHAVATAGLTAFGTLTIVHRGFVVLALASYVVPPIVLYVSRPNSPGQSPTEAALSDRSESDGGTDADRPGSDPTPTLETPAAADPGRRSADSSAKRERVAGDQKSLTNTAAVPTSEQESGTGSGESETHDSTPESVPQAHGSDDRPDEAKADPEWTTIDTAIDASLADATTAAGRGAAVGDGGVVLTATDTDWELTLDDGPDAQGQALLAVDATADGEVIWVAGDGGAVGRLTIETGRHTDYSAPDDRTDTLTGLAVAGPRDDETVLLANGSGEIVRGQYRDGDLTWEPPVKPGSGASLSGVTLVDADLGYCCDTNDGIFETTDGGATFEPVGIDGTDGTITDVTAGMEGDDCHVSTDAGVVHRYDGTTWTPDRITADPLSALDCHGDRLVTTDEAGVISDRADPASEWERIETDASGALRGVSVGPERSIAVGDAGTVIERR